MEEILSDQTNNVNILYNEIVDDLESGLEDIEKTEDVVEIFKNEELGMTSAERKAFIAEATEKSMHCMNVLEKALNVAKQVNDSQGKNKQSSEKIRLSLQDLIVASDEVDDKVKKVSSTGFVRKSDQIKDVLLKRADSFIDPYDGKDLDEKALNIPVKDLDFKQMYMEEFTDAFGDTLDQFRQDDSFEAKDVSYLIDCIKSGANVFQPLEKHLFVQSLKPPKM